MTPDIGSPSATGAARAASPRGAARVARVWVWGLASVACLGLAAVVSLRVAFPFALEWQEPGMYEHARRVFHGEPIYAAPDAGFAAFPYPPMFHWLGALSLGVFGESFLALRIVGLLGAALTFVLLGALVHRRVGATGAAAAVGTFAASYGFTGAWMDVARVDMLGLAGLMGAVSLMSPKAGPRAPLLAAGLAAAAVLTKQTMLPPALVLGASAFARPASRRAGTAYLAALGALLLGVGAWLQLASDGWFLFTVYGQLAGSPWHGPAIGGFWVESSVWVAATGGLLWLGRGGRSGDLASLAVGLSLVLVAWLGRAHEGGFDNTLLPLSLACAWGTGVGLGAALERRPLASALLLTAAFAFLVRDPRPWIPTEADRVEGERLAQRLSGVDGPIWILGGALRPGGPDSDGVHAMAVIDLLKARDTRGAVSLMADLEEKLGAQHYAAIVLDDDPGNWLSLGPLRDRYRIAEELTEGVDSGEGAVEARPPMTPRTGAPRRPLWLLLPR